MRYLKLSLAIAFVLAFTGVVKAENSATGYDATYRSQQVFVSAYAYAGVSKNDVVILDVTNSTNGSTKGAYINATTTTDSVYVFGVADEDIATGTLGRICVRGPHLTTMTETSGSVFGSLAGKIVGTSTTSGKASTYNGSSASADGTIGGQLGYVLSSTFDTTDTDAAWVWISPTRHK